MKKILTLLFVFGLISSAGLISCGPEEEPPPPPLAVQSVQKVFWVDVTATWCAPCGTTGTPFFKEICTSRGDKLIAFALHIGTSELAPYINIDSVTLDFPVMRDMLNVLEFSGSIPCFNLNQQAQPAIKPFIESDIDIYSAQTPLAQMNFEITKKSDSSFTIRSNTKFFKDTIGEFYQQFYIIESPVLHKQNTQDGYNNYYDHRNILRGCLFTDKKKINTFGDLIAKDTIKKGYSKEMNYSWAYKTSDYKLAPHYDVKMWKWNSKNIYIAGIIWKKLPNGKYKFINGLVKKY